MHKQQRILLSLWSASTKQISILSISQDLKPSPANGRLEDCTSALFSIVLLAVFPENFQRRLLDADTCLCSLSCCMQRNKTGQNEETPSKFDFHLVKIFSNQQNKNFVFHICSKFKHFNPFFAVVVYSLSESVSHSVMYNSFVTPWTVAHLATLSMRFFR